ncbi:hypothetical protein [Bacillus methanolicus]|uniref:hypothetical protein n=1 Tax=Bacillus methanolicus TaxID=1471 RepID=UPI00200F2889|nr:hypothetical protein [Bacillus methanolicus]
MKGVDGDKKAVKIAYEIFLKLRKTEPDNALIEAYYGSTLALLGRDAVQPLEKADKAQEGLDSLNQAISMDPNQVVAREHLSEAAGVLFPLLGNGDRGLHLPA